MVAILLSDLLSSGSGSSLWASGSGISPGALQKVQNDATSGAFANRINSVRQIISRYCPDGDLWTHLSVDVFSSSDPHNKGYYDGSTNTIYLNSSILQSLTSDPSAQAAYLQMTLDHEMQHPAMDFLNSSLQGTAAGDAFLNSEVTIRQNAAQDAFADGFTPSQITAVDNTALFNPNLGIYDKTLSKRLGDLAVKGLDGQGLGTYRQEANQIAEGHIDMPFTLDCVRRAFRHAVQGTTPQAFANGQGIAHSLIQHLGYDPLIVDLGHGGIQLTSLQNGIQFDLEDTGFAQQTAWLQPGSNSAMLVFDPTGGPITNGSQLLGQNTVLPDGTIAVSGFQALSGLADAQTVASGVLTASDPLFSQLRLLLADGTLITLSDGGIQSISLSYQNTDTVDTYGNKQLDIGTFTRTDGSSGFMGDFALVHDAHLSAPSTVLPETAVVSALPDVPGSGIVPSLHQAMLQDTSGYLESLVQQFATATDPSEQDTLLEQIMLGWAGKANDDSSGSHLTVVENLLGQTMVGVQSALSGANAVEGAYQLFKESTWAQLIVQSGSISALFDLISTVINPDTGSNVYDLSGLTAALQGELQTNYAQGIQDLANCYRALVDLGMDQNSDFAAFYASFASDPSLKFAMDTAGKQQYTGGQSATSTPDLWVDLSSQPDKADIGLGISDSIFWDKGSGNATIFETEYSTLYFGADITPGDVDFQSADGNTLTIVFKDTNETLTVDQEFDRPNGGIAISAFQFADGTRLSANDVLSQLSVYAQSGKDINGASDPVGQTYYANGNDTVTASTASDDVLIGGTGVETLIAGNGNDTLVSGVGETTMEGGLGGDLFVFAPGDGVATILEPTFNPLDPIQIPANKLDVLQIDAPLADVVFSAAGNDLVVTISGTNDIATIANELLPGVQPADTVQMFEFSDGNVLSLADIQDGFLTTTVPAGTASFLASDNSQIIQGAGNGTILTGNGNDTVYGGGNAIIVVGTGNDTIDAGAGTSTISGGSGDDTFIFNPGDGQQTISINGGNDAISFGGAIAQADLSFSVEGTNLILDFTGSPTDQITIQGQVSGDPSKAIQNFEFSDGSSLTWAQVEQSLTIFGTAPGDTIDRTGFATNDLIQGAGGNETILLGSGNDRVIVGTGNTSLSSGVGASTFVFAPDSGLLTVNEPAVASYTGPGDTLLFGSGVTPSDVSISQNGLNLVLSIPRTGDQVVLANALDPNATKQVQNIEFADGIALSLSQVTAVLSENNSTSNTSYDFSAETGGQYLLLTGTNDRVTLGSLNDVLIDQGGNATITTGAGDDFIFAGPGNDTINAGSGNAEIAIGTGNNFVTINSGAGNDQINYSAGDGSVTIYEPVNANPGASDVVSFGPGITASNINVQSMGQDLIIFDSNSNDRLVLSGALDPAAAKRVDLFQFADGTHLSLAQLLANGVAVNVTDTGEIFDRSFSTANENIAVSGDNDTVTTGAGADTVVVTGSNATVNTGSGDDTITLYRGTNVVNLGSGDNTLNLSAENDTVQSGSGSNTFNISAGGGIHEIVEPDGKAQGYSLDTVAFGAGLNESQIYLTESGANSNDLDIHFSGRNDEVILTGVLDPKSGSAVSDFQFSDGTDLSFNDLLKIGFSVSNTDDNQLIDRSLSNGNDQIVASGNNDTILLGAGDVQLSLLGHNSYAAAGSGNDAVNLGADDTYQVGTGHSQITTLGGNDTIDGGSGSYTLHFGYGSGQDKVNESYVANDSTDTIVFGPGITLSDLVLSEKNSRDLIISLANSSDQLYLSGQLDNTPHMVVTSFAFSEGTRLTAEQLLEALPVNVYTSNVVEDHSWVTTNESLQISGTNYEVILGTGNDNIGVEGNNDVIISSAGSGNDVITVGGGVSNLQVVENGQPAKSSAADIIVSAGLLANQVLTYSEQSGQLIVTDRVTGQQIAITNPFGDVGKSIKPITFKFADQTVSLQDLLPASGLSMNIETSNQPNIDQSGYRFNEAITLTGSNDQLALTGGADVSTVAGDNDKVILGSGADTLTANGVADSIQAGAGTSTITLAGTSESVVAGAGTAPTTIYVNGNNATIESKYSSADETIVVATGVTGLQINEDNQDSQGINSYGTDTVVLTGLAQNQVLSYSDDTGELTVTDSVTGQQFSISNVFNQSGSLNGLNPIKPILFQFGDGTQVSLQQLMQEKGLTITSSAPGAFFGRQNSTDPETVILAGNGDSYTPSTGNGTITASGDNTTVTIYQYPQIPGDYNVNLSGANDNLYAEYGNSVTANLAGTNDFIDQQDTFGPAMIEVSGANDVITSEQGAANQTIKVDASVTNLQINASSQQYTPNGTRTYFTANTPGEIILLPGLVQNQTLSYDADTHTLTITDSTDGQEIHITDSDGNNLLPTKPVQIQFEDGTQMSLQQLLELNGLSVSATSSSTDVNQQGYAFNETVTLGAASQTFEASAGNDTLTINANSDTAQLGAGVSQVTLNGANGLVETGSGTDQIIISGSNNRVDVEKSLAASQIEVQSNTAVVESTDGSGDVRITVDSGVSGLQLIEDGQDGHSVFGTDTVILQGLTQNQVQITTDAQGNILVNSLNGQRLVTIQNATTSGTVMKPVVLQFSDGSQVTAQQLLGTNGTTNTITVNGVEANQTLSFDGTNLTITDTTTGQQVVQAYSFDLIPSTVVQFSDGTNASLPALLQARGLDIGIATSTGVDLSGFNYSAQVTLSGSGSWYDSGAGNDVISASGANASVHLGSGTDQLTLTGDGASAVTGSGADNVAVSGNNETIQVAAGFVGNQITVSGQNDTIESMSGSSNSTVSIASTAQAVTLQEDAQGGTASYGTDTVVLTGLASDQTFAYDSATGSITMTDSITGQQIDFVDSTESVIKPIELQFADGTQVSLQDLVQQNGLSMHLADYAYYDDSQSSANETIVMGNEAGINTGSGNDVITANGAGEFVQMGSGDDNITITGANAYLTPTSGNSQIHITGDYAYIAGGTGDEQIQIDGKLAQVLGTTGNANITVSGDSAWISTGPGNAVIDVVGNLPFIETSGNSIISINGNNAVIESGHGDDSITVGSVFNDFDLSAPANGGSINGTDTLIFTTVLAQNLLLSYDTSTKVLTATDSASAQVFHIANALNALGKNIEFQFADNTSMSLQQLIDTNGLEFSVPSGSDVNHQGLVYNEAVILGGFDSSFEAGSGSVTVTASGTNDSVILGTGNDQLVLSGSHDYAKMGNGTSQTTVSGSNDSLTVLQGFGATTIQIDGQNDTVESQSGSGNETITLGTSATSFVLTEDQLAASTAYGTDRVVLNSLAQNLTLNYADATKTLTITDSVSGQQFEIVNALGTTSAGVKPIEFQFSDGNTMSLQQLLNTNMVKVSIGDNAISNQSDTNYAESVSITGGLSQFYAGSGNNVISVSGSNDFVQLGSGDETVSVTGANDSVQAAGGTAQLNLQSSTILYNANGQTMMTGVGSFDLDGSNQSLAFRGSSTVSLGNAVESFIFGYGSGNDVVDTTTASADSILQFASGVTLNDLVVSQQSDDLVISLLGSNDLITLLGQNSTDAITEFSFADGTEFTPAQFIAATSMVVIDSADSNTTFDESSSALNATITVTGSNDIIKATSANNTITASGSSETIYAGAGNDTIVAAGGGSIIYAGAGNDSITAGSGANVVYGGSGKATFNISKTDLSDTIYENVAATVPGTSDTVVFGAGISASDLSVSANGYDLIISVAGGPQVTLINGINSAVMKPITQFTFSDGTSMSLTQLLGAGLDFNVTQSNTTLDQSLSIAPESINVSGNNDSIKTGLATSTVNATGNNETITAGFGNATITASGGSEIVYAGAGNDTITTAGGNNTIYAGSGNDVIAPGVGNSTLYGGAGVSLFEISPSSDGSNESDTIYEQVAPTVAGQTDTLAFGAGISTGDLTFTSTGYDLVITDSAAHLSIDLVNELNPAAVKPIKSFTFSDGTSLNLAQLAVPYISVTNNQDGITLDRSFSIYNEFIQANGSNGSVIAGSGNDTIWVQGNNETVSMGSGNDVVEDFGSNDTVTAGSGTDQLVARGNNDTITAGSGSDTLTATGTNDVVNGGASTVQINVYGSGTIVNGGTGNETVDLYTDGLSFIGSSGTDYVVASGNNDTMTAGSGNSTLLANGNNETATAGSGSDLLYAFGANDVLNGGSSTVQMVAMGTGDIVNAGTGNEKVYLQADGLSFTGVGGTDYVVATANNDTITAGSGDTNVEARGNNDTITAGSGSDTISATGTNDVINCGSSTVQVNAYGVGTIINAGTGNETIYLNADGLSFTGATGTDNVTTAANNVTMTAGTGATQLTATGNNDTLSAGSGTDTLTARGTNDVLNGGSSTVQMNAYGTGAVITGGSGNETVDIYADDVSFTGTTGSDYVYSSANNDTMSAGSGTSTLAANGNNDIVTAGAGNDVLYAFGTNDVLNGGSSAVQMVAMGTGDIINAGTGNERVYLQADGLSFTGASGTDYVVATANNDTITAGTGATTVEARGNNDTITAGSASDSISATGTNDVVNCGSSTVQVNAYGAGTMINAGTGNETIYLDADGLAFNGTSGTDYVNTACNNDQVSIGTGTSTIVESGNADSVTVQDTNATITLSGANDALSFASSVMKDNIALFESGNTLQIGFAGDQNLITLNDNGTSAPSLQTLTLSDGEFMTAADLNLLIQQMTAYAADHAITLASVADVKANQDLMNMVASAWHS